MYSGVSIWTMMINQIQGHLTAVLLLLFYSIVTIIDIIAVGSRSFHGKRTGNTIAAAAIAVDVVDDPTKATFSSSSTKKQWKWNPEDIHPCNIRRYTDLEWQSTRLSTTKDRSMIVGNNYNNNKISNRKQQQQLSSFSSSNKANHNYGIVPNLYPEPIIIQRNRSINELFRNKTHYNQIVNEFIMNNYTNFTVTLSSSNAVCEHRKTMLLSDYIHEIYNVSKETLPNTLSNETWYLFGETYGIEWYTTLLQYYIVPPCECCTEQENMALSFGIGNRGSGVQWHIHGPGFSEAIHGRKHWILYPPTITNNHNTGNDTTSSSFEEYYNKDESSRYWMEYIYPTIPIKPYECTLDPGDIIYFPNHWWHATINLDYYTAFISTFTNEVQDEQRKEQQETNKNKPTSSLDRNFELHQTLDEGDLFQGYLSTSKLDEL